MLSDRCLSCPVLCPVCNVTVGVLWPNGWMDQDETWRAGRPRPWPHCVRWGLSSPSPKGAQPPIFGLCLLWPNGWMCQAATWHKGRPRPMPHCVIWGSPPKDTAAPPRLFGACLLWPRLALCDFDMRALQEHLLTYGRPSHLPLICCDMSAVIAGVESLSCTQ